MLSRASFKAELLAYRASMKPPKIPGAKGPDGLGSRNSADLELIERWLDDERVDDIWQKLKKANPNIEARTFIKTTCLARKSARGTVNRTYGADWQSGSRKGRTRGWADELRDVKAQISRRLSLPPSAIDPADVADFLESCAHQVRDYQLLFNLSDHGGLRDRPKFQLSQKDQAGTRVRLLFMQIMGDYFFSTTGKWMDEQVAALTEIAFPGKELDRDDASTARKPRTKAGRGHTAH